MHDRGPRFGVRHPRLPPGRHPSAASPTPLCGQPTTARAPSRLPGGPGGSVPSWHQAILEADDDPQGYPDRRPDGKEPEHAASRSWCPTGRQGRKPLPTPLRASQPSGNRERRSWMRTSPSRLETLVRRSSGWAADVPGIEDAAVRLRETMDERGRLARPRTVSRSAQRGSSELMDDTSRKTALADEPAQSAQSSRNMLPRVVRPRPACSIVVALPSAVTSASRCATALGSGPGAGSPPGCDETDGELPASVVRLHTDVRTIVDAGAPPAGKSWQARHVVAAAPSGQLCRWRPKKLKTFSQPCIAAAGRYIGVW